MSFWSRASKHGKRCLLTSASGSSFPAGPLTAESWESSCSATPKKRAWLNRCLHPKVFEVYTTQVRHLSARQPDAIVVFDAALLIETGYHKKMDKVIVVYADEEHQLKRLMERDRFTHDQAVARIRSQMPLGEKRLHADYVVENTGNREETERQTREIFELLKKNTKERT